MNFIMFYLYFIADCWLHVLDSNVSSGYTANCTGITKKGALLHMQALHESLLKLWLIEQTTNYTQNYFFKLACSVFLLKLFSKSHRAAHRFQSRTRGHAHISILGGAYSGKVW